MTRYNVHIYREMRLLFTGIEATSHEEAAAKARDMLTESADEVEDCEGATLSALVDVVGTKITRSPNSLTSGIRDDLRR